MYCEETIWFESMQTVLKPGNIPCSSPYLLRMKSCLRAWMKRTLWWISCRWCMPLDHIIGIWDVSAVCPRCKLFPPVHLRMLEPNEDVAFASLDLIRNNRNTINFCEVCMTMELSRLRSQAVGHRWKVDKSACNLDQYNYHTYFT